MITQKYMIRFIIYVQYIINCLSKASQPYTPQGRDLHITQVLDNHNLATSHSPPKIRIRDEIYELLEVATRFTHNAMISSFYIPKSLFADKRQQHKNTAIQA